MTLWLGLLFHSGTISVPPALDGHSVLLTSCLPIQSIFSTFFRLGQTLETFRGKGVYQPSVDTAIQKLSEGHWIHLFSEGKVNQPNTYSIDSGYAHLPRFKWGVGRILMEAPILPVIIPMWLTGFDRLMPEGRTFPYKYFPRPGAELTVTFGDPIPARDITSCLDSCLSNRPERLTAGTSDATFEASKARAAVTTLIHQRVEELGRAVSGNELAAPLSSPHQC